VDQTLVNTAISGVQESRPAFEIDDLAITKQLPAVADIDFSAIDTACRSATVGKLLPGALYVHVSAIDELPAELRSRASRAQVLLSGVEPALLKFHRFKPRISFLVYPNFDKDPHPALTLSALVCLDSGNVVLRDYSLSANPPVLHRKETFVAPGYPGRDVFAALTRQEESCGLLDNATSIGTRRGWEERLAIHGFTLQDHRLVGIRSHDRDMMNV
jgi:DNA phosphorothioation-associated putative methyltransferase